MEFRIHRAHVTRFGLTVRDYARWEIWTGFVILRREAYSGNGLIRRVLCREHGAMLDDEATELLRRHLRGRRSPGSLLVKRADVEREVGATRARDLDTWVVVNGGWLVAARAGVSELQYAVPRELFDKDDSPIGEQPANSA